MGWGEEIFLGSRLEPRRQADMGGWETRRVAEWHMAPYFARPNAHAACRVESAKANRSIAAYRGAM
jgi:hypothetical protein